MNILLSTDTIKVEGSISSQAFKGIPGILFKEFAEKSMTTFEQKNSFAGKESDFKGLDLKSKGYTGILHVRCNNCGSTKTFCPTSPTDRFVCPNCNRQTLLKDLLHGEYLCSCGRKAFFKTNIEKDSFDIRCGSCDKLITMHWDPLEKIYVNFSEEEGSCAKME